MVTPVNRVAYAYLQESITESQNKNNNTPDEGSQNILKKLLSKFFKYSRSNSSI